MRVTIRDIIFEGTPEEIREYVNNDQEYINEMVFKYNKCPICKNNLGEIQTSEPMLNCQGQYYISYRRKCKQCKQFWVYNDSWEYSVSWDKERWYNKK